ncbi:MAG: YfiR family protein [Salinivirgaceae bacterium]|jgi:hypothetical protein|nr:YfiR family protein [Salinivirgaceae bacterium]
MRKVIFGALIVVFSSTVSAQDAELAKYKAMFTLNFIRYIGWPDAAKEGDFVIGVLKESALTEQLSMQTVGKRFGTQNIVIKQFKTVEEVTYCQILYFSKNLNYSKNAVTVIQKLNGKNALIITETEGATEKGSMINFVVRDDKLKFEISASNADKFGLKFSSSLTALSNAIVK